MFQGRLEQEYLKLPRELRLCSEFELCEKVDPGPTDYKMRQNMTDAVELARKTGKKIRLTSVYEDVVTKQVFFEWYLPKAEKVAFITRPVVPHHAYFDAIYKEGLRKLFTYVKTHQIDSKTVATFAKIVDKATDRAIGPVVQRIQMAQKQEITHVSGDPREVTPDDPALLEQKLKEMQAKLNKIKPIEIEAASVDIED